MYLLKFPNVKRKRIPLIGSLCLSTNHTDSHGRPVFLIVDLVSPPLVLLVYNATACEDLITRPDVLGSGQRVCGVVTNFTLVTLAHGLQSCMDPQTITCPVVISTCGHEYVPHRFYRTQHWTRLIRCSVSSQRTLRSLCSQASRRGRTRRQAR